MFLIHILENEIWENYLSCLITFILFVLKKIKKNNII